MLALLVLCSLLLVNSQHQARRLFIALEQAQLRQQQLETEVALRTRDLQAAKEAAEAETAAIVALVGVAAALAAVAAERECIYGLVRQREISDELARRLVRDLDLMEARYR